MCKKLDNTEEVRKVFIKWGAGIGTILSAIISYDLYHNVFWAVLHGMIGWFYIIYFLLVLNK